ncbi:hypothetical protein ACQR35_04745 [Pseudarthrobacter sp. J1738]|uniref:hypothetical protein n=1 Tax=unclassified Pseudarthrobacter TaxID=2647000 RepID=UPI003D2C4BF9
MEHETTLEHALDVAQSNHKEALRLLAEAKAGVADGHVSPERVSQLEELLATAKTDLERVQKEN